MPFLSSPVRKPRDKTISARVNPSASGTLSDPNTNTLTTQDTSKHLKPARSENATAAMNSNLALPPVARKPSTTNEGSGDLDQFMQSDDFLQMISDNSLANSSMFDSLPVSEQHVLPQMDMQLPTPPLMEPNTLMGPSFHPLVGWYFPALPASGIATPVRLFPIISEGYTPAASVVPSAMPSGRSTPIPFQAPQKPKGRRKYGPAAYLEEQAAKARLGVNTGSSDLPPPSATPSTKKPSAPHPLRNRKNPPIVQSCVCNDKETLKIKRPKNAFIIFRKSVSQGIIDSLGGRNDNQAVSKIAAEMWRKRSSAVDKKFKDLAVQEKARHEMMYPGYKYQPGQSSRNKFGSASCSCGAYEANMRAMRAREGMDSEDDEESDGEEYSPRQRRTSACAPTAPMQVPIPDPSTFGFSTPAQRAEAAAFVEYMKRKRDAADLEDEEQPLAKRRSPRNSKKSVTYTEPVEEDIFRPISPTETVESRPSQALDASPTLSAAGFARDDSPARNTRSSVSKAPSPELAQTAFPFDFGEDMISADADWEKLFEESGLLAEVQGDADSDGDNIVVANRRPSSRGRSSIPKSVEVATPRRSSRKVSK